MYILMVYVAYPDDAGYISGRLLHIWTTSVTYLDDCYTFWRWHICASHDAVQCQNCQKKPACALIVRDTLNKFICLNDWSFPAPPKCRHTIIWSNHGMVYWCIYSRCEFKRISRVLNQVIIKSPRVFRGFIVFGPFPPPAFCQHFSTFREYPWS